MNNTAAILSRIKSIRQTVQISNAQKLIAAARIGRAKRMLADAAPYHERIRSSIAGVLTLCPEAASRYLDKTGMTPSRRGLLVITSDKGLAGGYNSNVVKTVEQSMKDAPASRLIVLGNVGRNHFTQKGYDVLEPPALAYEPPTLFAARELAEQIFQMFDEGQVDAFDIAYTHFRSTVRLQPTESRLFPLKPQVFGDPPVPLRQAAFEPSPDAVLETLIVKYLKGFIYGCLIHAWASELASRVTAMDNAIRNGRDMLDALLLVYNHARQAMITQEITEIVAGAASMNEE